MDKKAYTQSLREMWDGAEANLPLKDALKRYALPALAATAGTGSLAAYLTSRTGKRAGETRAQRRRRILRNALVASGLTGAAAVSGIGAASLAAGRTKDEVKPSLSDVAKEVLKDEATGYIPAGVGAVAGYGASKLPWFGGQSAWMNAQKDALATKLDMSTAAMDRLPPYQLFNRWRGSSSLEGINRADVRKMFENDMLSQGRRLYLNHPNFGGRPVDTRIGSLASMRGVRGRGLLGTLGTSILYPAAMSFGGGMAGSSIANTLADAFDQEKGYYSAIPPAQAVAGGVGAYALSNAALSRAANAVGSKTRLGRVISPLVSWYSRRNPTIQKALRGTTKVAPYVGGLAGADAAARMAERGSSPSQLAAEILHQYNTGESNR